MGTHALYAYESLSDIHFLPAVMETQDLDVLWDSSARLIATIAGKTSESTMPRLLDVLAATISEIVIDQDGLPLEIRAPARPFELALELFQRGHARFGDVTPSELAAASARQARGETATGGT